MKNTLYGYMLAGAMLALAPASASADTLVWLSARPADGAIVTTSLRRQGTICARL